MIPLRLELVEIVIKQYLEAALSRRLKFSVLLTLVINEL